MEGKGPCHRGTKMTSVPGRGFTAALKGQLSRIRIPEKIEYYAFIQTSYLHGVPGVVLVVQLMSRC
jgi:hypothetical protein